MCLIDDFFVFNHGNTEFVVKNRKSVSTFHLSDKIVILLAHRCFVGGWFRLIMHVNLSSALKTHLCPSYFEVISVTTMSEQLQIQVIQKNKKKLQIQITFHTRFLFSWLPDAFVIGWYICLKCIILNFSYMLTCRARLCLACAVHIRGLQSWL